MKSTTQGQKEAEINPSVKKGDRIQIGTELVSGGIFWGTIQTVTRVYNGRPMYRPKWGKVDKIADHLWRKKKDDLS